MLSSTGKEVNSMEYLLDPMEFIIRSACPKYVGCQLYNPCPKYMVQPLYGVPD